MTHLKTHITLIRHGETAWNASDRWQGHAHVPLNDEGQRQAALLGDHLVPIADEITTIYSSDLLRARQTAEIIAARITKTITVDARWREIDLGEWQGLTIAEVRAWDAERYHHIMSDPVNLQRPGGESSKQVAERALQSIEEITRKHRGQHVLVVTHGGTIRNLLDHLGLWDKNNPVIDNTAHSRLLHQADPAVPWILDTFNVRAHLDNAPIQDSQDRYP